MRNSLRITVLLLAVGLVVLAAGCGGGKKAASNKIGATGTGGTGHMGITGGTGATGQSGAAGFARSKNCLEFANLAAQLASAMAPAAADAANAPDTAAQELKALADAAPDAIKGDLQTIATAFTDFVQKAKDAGYDFSSGKTPNLVQIAKLSAAAQLFNSKDLSHAEQHLSTWEQKNCTMK